LKTLLEEPTAALAPTAAPLVAILLATCNGRRWLVDQLNSIALQTGVRVHVVASDDQSTDGTRAMLEQSRRTMQLTLLDALPQRLGNANRNFIRLICDADVGNADFIALADQDDLWTPDKLLRAVRELSRTRADAYSSDVTAFWPDGREKVLIKSKPQRRFDHCFEAPGPGCTFVIRRAAYESLSHWARSQRGALQQIKVHDWLIYAYGRCHGWSWHIDPFTTMRYRQHPDNEIGANVGWRAAQARWQQLRGGQFRLDALAIARVVGNDSAVVCALRRLSWQDRCRLAIAARECRRDAKEAAILALSLLVMKKQ
jgi:rhamnosyltransferase